MRQIKFRGFPKSEYAIKKYGEKMLYNFGDAYDNDKLNDLIELEQKHFHLMQFTGLLDKHGKEIYEFDVVESKDWHTDADGRCVISDANSYMKKEVIEYRTKEPFVGFTIPSKCEVIGNIYEDSHLLQ